MASVINLIKPAVSSATAASRLAEQQAIIRHAIAEDGALVPKVQAYMQEQRASTEADELVTQFRGRDARSKAAAELGDPPPEPRAELEQAAKAALANAMHLRERAAVASAALTRIAVKRRAISDRRHAAEQQLPRLLLAVIEERIVERVPTFERAVEGIAAEVVELFALVDDYDAIASTIPGTAKLDADRVFTLAIPIPAHSAFKAVRRDVAKEAAARAAAILRELQP